MNKNLRSIYLAALFAVALMVAGMTPVVTLAQQVETVVEGLHNPTGIAIQPETGHVFVAESGALRVIRIVDGKIEPVIVDFPKDVYGKGPIYDVGPLGLLFIDKNTLVVGGGGQPDGEDMLRVYTIPEPGSDPIPASQMAGDPKTLSATDELPGEGNFYGLARGDEGVFVTCNGDDAKGWIGLATLEGGKLKDFKRHIATQEATGVNAPVAITISPEGYVTVGQMGKIDLAGDSVLTFYRDGKMEANFETGISDITGLAYSPQQGFLFATDFNWLSTDQGGLYKIIRTSDEKVCKTRKIADLEKPTALAFHPEGDLYITLAGNMAESAKEPDGKLVMIKGLDDDPQDK